MLEPTPPPPPDPLLLLYCHFQEEQGTEVPTVGLSQEFQNSWQLWYQLMHIPTYYPMSITKLNQFRDPVLAK